MKKSDKKQIIFINKYKILILGRTISVTQLESTLVNDDENVMGV